MRLFHVLSLSGVAIASAAQNRYAALPIIPEGLTPRYFIDRSHPLAKREGSCGDNSHSCLDIGHGDSCCDNNSYCYINTSNEPKCCGIGLTCASDNPCPASAVRCTVTTTLTFSRTSSPSKTSAKESTITSTSTTTGCCGRACPNTSQYLCAKTLGGNCCSFNANCEAGGGCVFTKTNVPPGLSPAADGCTTSQFRCSDGNGCCDNGETCTSFSGSAYCSTATGGPTSTLVADAGSGSSSSSFSGGLSAGAQAGIAVGAVVGGGLIVAAAAWFYFRRRRAAAATRVYNGAYPPSGDGNIDAVVPGDPAMGTAPTSPQTWRQRWTMVSSVTPSGAVTDAGTIRSPSSAPDPVELGTEERSEIGGSEVASPKSDMTSVALTGLRTPETVDGRFELGGTEGNWPLPSPASPEPSPQPQEPNPISGPSHS
ncbi:hypothetical protein ACHAQJ_000662 [Trichoderma viride]